MNQSLLRINRARFRSDLAALAGIGRNESTQILSREIDSEADRAAQAWLQRRISAAQLQPPVDCEGAVVAAVGAPQALRRLVIVGETISVPSDRPVVGAFALVAGLECLRCLSESETVLNAEITLALTAANETSTSVAIRYVDNELLNQAARLIGLEIRAPATITMREICAIGEDCGISVLPLPTPNESARQEKIHDTQTYRFVLDEVLANWPIDNWTALEASANLLLNFVYKFATAS